MINVLGARVVVKETEPEEVTAGGIFIPDSAQDKAYRGEIVAVGPGYRKVAENGDIVTIPVDVKVGDNVIFAKFAGSAVKVDDEEYVVINERDILAVLN